MGMPQSAERWTAAQVRALPDDGQRYEAVDGELLVTPAPSWSHQRAVAIVWRMLDDHVRTRSLGEAVISPADVELDAHTVVQPDVFVVPLIDGWRMNDWSDINGRLLLAIEVLSPSSARADRHVKRKRYQGAGIPEYWIVDLDARLIERWRPDDARPEILTERLVWSPAANADSLELDVAEYFRQVGGSRRVAGSG